MDSTAKVLAGQLVRWEAHRALVAANPWDPVFCRPDCDGYYPGTDPETGTAARVACDRWESAKCAVWSAQQRARWAQALQRVLLEEGFGRRYIEGLKGSLVSCRDRLDAYASSWEENVRGGYGLVLVGPCGTGKSRALAYLGARLHDKGVERGDVRCYDGPDLLSVIEAERGKRLPRDVAEVPFLLLDDVGARDQAPWVREHLPGIIQQRYRESLPLVLASNLAVGEIGGLVGERSSARLAEQEPGRRPLFEVIAMAGPVLRGVAGGAA